eukprot:4639447-Amphidinium_carterae.1
MNSSEHQNFKDATQDLAFDNWVDFRVARQIQEPHWSHNPRIPPYDLAMVATTYFRVFGLDDACCGGTAHTQRTNCMIFDVLSRMTSMVHMSTNPARPLPYLT